MFPRLRSGTWPALVLIAWGASRWFAWHQGIRFDSSDLSWAWQFLDLGELRAHLGRSLWYLHAQPPGFNLFLGLGLELARNPGPFYQAVFIVLGAGLELGLYVLARQLGISPPGSFLCACFFAWSPSSMLYENWLFYMYPAAALLTFSAVALAAAVRSHSTLAWSAFFALLCALVFSVAIFHLLWFAICLGILVRQALSQRRRILMAASPWLVLSASLYVKNAVVLGSFAASSWAGMNLARVAESAVPLAVREQAVLEGQVSPLATIPPFLDVGVYPEGFRDVPPGTPDVPVLLRPRNIQDTPNFNHIAYVGISRAYREDSLFFIWHRPMDYLFVVARSFLVFWLPPSEHVHLAHNRARIAGYADLFNVLLYGCRIWGPAPPPPWTDPRQLALGPLLKEDGLLWAILACGALIASGIAISRRLRRGEALVATASLPAARITGGEPVAPASLPAGRTTGRQPIEMLTLAYMVGTVLWVATVGNLCEYGENNRFRFMVEPFLLILVVKSLGNWTRSAARAFGRPRARAFSGS